MIADMSNSIVGIPSSVAPVSSHSKGPQNRVDRKGDSQKKKQQKKKKNEKIIRTDIEEQAEQPPQSKDDTHIIDCLV